MKQSELRKHRRCSNCKKFILESGIPLFYRVTVERFGVDLNAVKRQGALEILVGSAAIAAVMGPGETMATPVMDASTLTICETCSLDQTCVAQMAEMAQAGPR